MHYSPLRYPGGKNKLAAFIANVCLDNNIKEYYVEPYCGGASVALFLLLKGVVEKIIINDQDRSIYAFWHSVLNNTKKLCDLIHNAEFTIEEWKKQKQVQKNKAKASLLELGFSTFYLNRTNISGIISAGVIGGVNQNGNYLMDCRFNKVDLINKINNIAARKKDITLYKKDAIVLVDYLNKKLSTNNVLVYFDPPYYYKAKSLYMHHYNNDMHNLVSQKIKSIQEYKWIVSYDNVEEIRILYEGLNKKEFSFTHTAYKSRVGKEIMFFSDNILTSNLEEVDPIKSKLVY